MRGSLAGYVKRRFLKEPEHPNSVAFLLFALLIGCLAVAMGLFGGFRGWLLPGMWVVLGLYYAMWGVAETLPARRRRVSVILRAMTIAMLLATIIYLAVATVAFNV